MAITQTWGQHQKDFVDLQHVMDLLRLIQQPRSSDTSGAIRRSTSEAVDAEAIRRAYQDPVRDAFKRWFAARGMSEKRVALAQLESVGNVDSIVAAAFDEFENRGNAERLVAAADLLQRRGADSLPRLQQLIHSGISEGEYFIEAIVNIAQNSLSTDGADHLLEACVRHPERNVRFRVADNADALPDSIRAALLQRLTTDSDERVSDAAKDALDRA